MSDVTERPTFLTPDLPEKRPEMGELNVGDTVWIVEPSHRHARGGGSPPALAVLESKARVWATFRRQEEGGYPKEWRLRLDTQTDGQQSNWATSFRTPAQQLWHWAHSEASAYLREQKIITDYGSPWGTEAGTMRLARIIWEATNVDG
jgi:hypothetical protein